MIGIRSAISIRARGHRPHLEAVYMTAPRSVCRNTKKALPRGGRPYMTRERVIPRACGGSSTRRLLGSITDFSGILDHPPEPVIGRRIAPTRWRVMTTEGVARLDPVTRRARVIPRACGGSSTPRLLGSITDFSGILDHP